MPHSHPRPTPPTPYIPKSSKPVKAPSIAGSSIYLTPIQSQRINSWRIHASAPSSPVDFPIVPTPGLTNSASPTTGTGSPASEDHHPHASHQGLSKAQIRSAPASLLAPAGGSLCKACGGSCGCNTLSVATHPVGRNTPPSMPMPQSAGDVRGKDRGAQVPLRNFTPTAGMEETETGTGSSSRTRSYYSTKMYRRARAEAMREQSGFAGMGMDQGGGPRMGGGGGGGDGRRASGGGGGQYAGGHGEPLEQMQNDLPPDWIETERDPREFVQAVPVVQTLPRIGGARDPISQQYWRNMFPPTGGIKGINSGLAPSMLGMGMVPPQMMGMPPPGMMFH